MLLHFDITTADNSSYQIILPRSCSIGDLKAEIFSKSGIYPSQQLLIGWSKTPETDDTSLSDCCNLSNNLILFNKAMENSENVAPESDNNSPKKKSTKEATEKFIRYFESKYQNPSDLFCNESLTDIIEKRCLAHLSIRKILILYFHNSKDPFADIFCRNIMSDKVKELMENKFCILPWDIEDVTYHDAIKEALNYSPNLIDLVPSLEKQKCGAFIIVPIKQSIMIFSYMNGKLKDENFKDTIKYSLQIFKEENEIEETLKEDDSGSLGFQQMMLDLLGNRDYDSFEFHEHEHLKKKIGYAFYGPPENEEWKYDSKQQKKIEKIYKIILEESNKISKWKDRIIVTIIYVCAEPLPTEKLARQKKYPDYNAATDLIPIPLFILRKCKHAENPCRIFIDDTGRVYRSWTEYLSRNKLDKCYMVAPKNGKYQADENGQVMLEKMLSPACGIDAKILRGTDIASSVLGLASGGVFIAAAIPTIAVAPVALVAAGVTSLGVGLYAISRSAYSLYDRTRHKESLSFLNTEARGAYINIVAGAFGFAGAGANIIISQLATRGVQIGQTALLSVNVLNATNVTVSGVAIVNSGYEVFDRWWNENQKPSLLTIVQFSSSILFFGHALYNFKSASTIVEEAQTSALKNYQDSLRSNRHRKVLNKILKETVKQNEGNIIKGQAEVIATLRNIKNRDEVFAALARSNKDLNKYSVKLSARNGEVYLNNIEIDMTTFSSMDKTDRFTYLSEIPLINNDNLSSSSASADYGGLKTIVKDSFPKLDISNINILSKCLFQLIGNTNDSIAVTILTAAKSLIEYLESNNPQILQFLKDKLPDHNYYFHIVLSIMKTYQILINKKEEQYQSWRENPDSSNTEIYFPDLSSDNKKRASEIFNHVILPYFTGNMLNQNGLSLLLEYFYSWLANLICEVKENEENRKQRASHSAASHRKKCDICCGYYYSN